MRFVTTPRERCHQARSHNHHHHHALAAPRDVIFLRSVSRWPRSLVRVRSWASRGGDTVPRRRRGEAPAARGRLRQTGRAQAVGRERRRADTGRAGRQVLLHAQRDDAPRVRRRREVRPQSVVSPSRDATRPRAVPPTRLFASAAPFSLALSSLCRPTRPPGVRWIKMAPPAAQR